MPVAYVTLAIEGFHGQPVPNELVHQQAGSDTLAVLLPGRWYTCDMPLFYYAERLLVDRGWDVLRVQYDYRRLDRSTSQDEQPERLRVDCRAALDTAMANGDYDRVVLVGKSLGTIAMAHLLPTLEGTDSWSAWLTPLLKQPEVLECVAVAADRSIVVIGSEDSHYEPALLGRLAAEHGCKTLVIGGGEHSLDLQGDAAGSAMSMVTTIRAIDRFLPGDSEER